LAIAIATGSESELRTEIREVAAAGLDSVWVDELILQSYLFAGFPRTLNAAREWRRASGVPAPSDDDSVGSDRLADWTRRGEATCAIVYGDMYERLRVNIRALHPALDAWMIVDGYGKVLGRSGLDLRRRELCIVAVCAAVAQERQLHAHLYGALHAGASPGEVSETLGIASERLEPAVALRFRQLWNKVHTLA
jgi:4-carboxymuconolactone decarboxylase